MTSEFAKLDDIRGNLRNGRGITNKVLDLIRNNEEVLVFHCSSNDEALSVYQTIYACSKRRHNLNIKRFRKGNDIYIVNLNTEVGRNFGISAEVM